jgi:lysozyme
MTQQALRQRELDFKNALITQLRRDEDEVLHAYADPLGYITIGVGRLIDKRKGGGITADESAYLLSNDIDARLCTLLPLAPWIDDLDEARKGVIVNMAFQMGVTGLLGFKNTLALVQAGEYAKASKAMLKSLWARQTPARARRLAEQMKTGIWQ